jgi:hypothetical protein
MLGVESKSIVFNITFNYDLIQCDWAFKIKTESINITVMSIVRPTKIIFKNNQINKNFNLFQFEC